MMNSRKKNLRIMAIGLLLVVGSNLLMFHKSNLYNFANGFMKGLGITLEIWAIYRMRRQQTAA